MIPVDLIFFLLVIGAVLLWRIRRTGRKIKDIQKEIVDSNKRLRAIRHEMIRIENGVWEAEDE